jgi:hypothetical protein
VVKHYKSLDDVDVVGLNETTDISGTYKITFPAFLNRTSFEAGDGYYLMTYSSESADDVTITIRYTFDTTVASMYASEKLARSDEYTARKTEGNVFTYTASLNIDIPGALVSDSAPKTVPSVMTVTYRIADASQGVPSVLFYIYR